MLTKSKRTEKIETSSKAKVLVKAKLIARRSPEEGQFLEDVATCVAKSRSTGREELFCFHKQDGTEVPLRGRTIREELKKICESNGLPPAYFSSRSLRKGAITHLRATG